MIGATPPLVVVSIVNWNTAERTLQCLRSLQALPYSNYRIVLVDNASRDDSVARVRTLYPQLTILQSPDNRGFAGGHELACRQALDWGADAIWLVNSDAQADAQALSRLVEAWQRHGDAVYGGVPLLRRDDGTVLLNFPAKYLVESGRPRAFQRDADLEFGASWQERAPFRVGAAAGSCFFLPLQLVRSHGWLDPAWFLYCEEIDYCYRLRSLGVACYLVPQARIWHGGGGSHQDSQRVADCIHYYRARNEIVLAQRYTGRVTAWLTAAKKLARAAYVWTTNARRGRLILRGACDAIAGRMGKTQAPEDAAGN